jgi:hypothetical protein
MPHRREWPTVTALLADETARLVVSPNRPPTRPTRLRRLTWPLVVGAAAAGTVVVGYSYRLSAQAYPANLYYLVFWAGMLVAALPVSAKLAAPATARSARLWSVLLFGIVTAMPKFLRNPTEPRYHDEYAHWREAVDAASSGQLFRPNTLIPIVEFFPGTSALTVTTHWFSGLSLWSAGTLVVLTMHVLGLFAVYLLGEVTLSSARAGGVAAVVYGINPSAIYFDTQYAYESVAINLFLWTLALTALAAQAGLTRRWAFYLTATVSALGCVVIHHLTTLFLIAALGTVALTATIHNRWLRRSSRELRAWWIMLGVTIVLAVAWVMLVARPTLAYLSPYFGNSLQQLGSMAEKKGDGGRQLLAANAQPMWEQLLTAAAPLVLVCVVIAAALLARRRQVRLASPTWGLIAFGLGYFVSIPFILAPSGAEGARRAWGFTYIGVALIVALVTVYWPRQRASRPSPRWRVPLTVGVFVILLIGNVGGGLNDPYRFPGPFRWGTDTNSASDEARTVARELAARVGRVRVATDAYTALQLAAYGGLIVAAPSVGFPTWDLSQTGDDPPPELAGMMVSSGYDYLVIDIRMAEESPFNGHNFGPGDPLVGRATPMEYLTRLDSVPWASRVITTEHLRVYRLDLFDIATRMQGRS